MPVPCFSRAAFAGLLRVSLHGAAQADDGSRVYLGQRGFGDQADPAARFTFDHVR